MAAKVEQQMRFAKWEVRLILRLRALRNRATCGIISVTWNTERIAVVTGDNGLETVKDWNRVERN